GDDLAAGRLESVLDDWSLGAGALHLVTPPGTLRPARVEAVIDYLAERLRAGCGAAGGRLPPDASGTRPAPENP
ncbi:MAG: hypothetical protein ABW182_12845, partial [Sphingomonas sp.]